jgi:hypothetical protein
VHDRPAADCFPSIIVETEKRRKQEDPLRLRRGRIWVGGLVRCSPQKEGGKRMIFYDEGSVSAP